MAFSQEERGFLSIKGQVLFDNTPLKEVKVTAIRNNKIFAVTQTDKHGKFKLSLEFFYDYTIILEKESFYTMEMAANTRLPADLLPMWPTFSIKIPFFRRNDPDVDLNLFRDPFALINFDLTLKKFTDANRDKFLNPIAGKETNEHIKELAPQTKIEIVTPAERKEENKQDARKNLAEKRKQESELLEKVRNKNTHETNALKPIKNNTHDINEQLAVKRETSRKMNARKSEEMNELFAKRFSQISNANNYRTLAQKESGFFNTVETFSVFKNDKLIYEFKRKSPLIGEDEFFINQKKVLSTEYFFKLNQFVK